MLSVPTSWNLYSIGTQEWPGDERQIIKKDYNTLNDDKGKGEK